LFLELTGRLHNDFLEIAGQLSKVLLASFGQSPRNWRRFRLCFPLFGQFLTDGLSHDDDIVKRRPILALQAINNASRSSTSP